MLASAPCLPSATHLDISHHTGLGDGELVLALSRCSRRLTHLAASGTALGALSLMMLGTQVSTMDCV